MKHSYITALLAAAGSSAAFQPNNFQKISGQRTSSSPPLFATNENDDANHKSKLTNKSIDTLLHVANPLRQSPLTPKEELIYKHLVEPATKLTGGCAALGAVGILTAVAALKITSHVLKENLPDTFINKNPIERIIQSKKPSADINPHRFTDRFLKDKIDSSKERENKPKCNEETDFCRYPAINIYSISSGETAERC